MDLEVLASLSWREALFAVIVLLALYVLVVFLRIRRLKRGNAVASIPEAYAAQSAVAAYEAVQKPSPSAPAESPVTLSDVPFPWNEPPPSEPDPQKIESIEREVAQLRKEVGGLRAEVMVLREEKRREQLKPNVTQNASPLYSDAMQMAMQGHDAATISQHCGIARAEAELVVALVRNQDSR